MTTWIRNIKTCFWIFFFLGGLKISTISLSVEWKLFIPKVTLQNLQHKYLIQRVEGGILYKHEQSRDMGQNIAMELPVMNCFIWKSNIQISFYKKMRLSPYYFNLMILF
jgi:hypothetical protein